MSIVHSDNVFKVVSTAYGKRSGISGPHSALLKNSPATIDYSLATGNGVAPNHFVAPKVNGTPILLYADLENARLFAASDPRNRKIYRAEIYGEVMDPVAKVLKLNLGWNAHAVAFWAAMLAGEAFDAFPTRTAPAGTIAIFGVVRLLEHVR